MGGKGSGNRRPRKKADPDEKSRGITIRLNPRNPKHLWALDYVYNFDYEQGQKPEDARLYRGDLFVDALAVYAGYTKEERPVEVSAQDVADIRDIVEYILDRIENGGIVSSGAGKRQKREHYADISESMQATIDHYISSGFTGDNDLDED